MSITLQPGDEIRVIAPSDSWKTSKIASYQTAEQRLDEAGYKVTFGSNVKSQAYLGTALAQQRADDLNAAYADNAVKAIIALHGGFFANEVLPLVDWNLVRAHPKPLIGYSDVTILLNAIYAKTGLVNYLGPNFGTLGYENAYEYSLRHFLNMLTTDSHITLEVSSQWFENDIQHDSEPRGVLQAGEAEGILLGGNIQSFYLLQGTEYQPSFDQDFILAVEADELAGEYTLHELSRSLESILQLANARQNLKGVLIGRFKTNSKVAYADLQKVIKAKHIENIPVVSNVDFGHTMPIATLPIGGKIKITADEDTAVIELR